MAERKLCAGCLRDDENIAATSWCSSCLEEVCNACAKAHRKLNPPHEVVPLHHVSDLSSSLLRLTKYCDVHSDQKVALFCTQHDKVICDLCLSEIHKNCQSVMTIERAAKGSKSGTAIEGLQNRMRTLKDTFRLIIDKQTESVNSLERQKKEILQQISTVRQQMEKDLDKSENNVKQELDNRISVCKRNSEKVKKHFEAKEDNVKSWLRDIDSLKSSSSEVHFFQTIKVLDFRTHKEESEIPQQSQTSRIEFKPCDSNRISLTIGQILEKKEPIRIPYIQSLCQQGQVPKEQREATTTTGNAEISEPELENDNVKKTFSFKTSIFGADIKVQKGCFLSSDKLFLAANKSPYVYLCNYDGTNIKTVKLQNEPWDVAVVDKNHAIIAFGAEGYQVLNLTTLTTGQCMKPRGLGCYAAFSRNGELWIDTGAVLSQLDLSGNVIRTAEKKYAIGSLCRDNRGDIYYTAPYIQDIYKVTPDGKFATFFISDKLRGLSGIDVDNCGNIYVAGSDSNNIHKISTDKENHQIVLDLSNGIKYPQGLKYNQDTKELMVFNNYLKSVEIFKLT